MSASKAVLVGLLLITIANTQVVGQDCTAILGYVRDLSSREHTLQSVSSFKRFFCEQTFSSYQSAHDASIRLGIPVDDIPVEISGSNRDTNWSQYQHKMCESVSNLNTLNIQDKERIEKANSRVVDAWERCVSSPGTKFWAEANDTDPKLVSLVMRFNSMGPPYSISANTLVINPNNNMTCSRPNIFDTTRWFDSKKQRLLDSREKRLECKRWNNEAVNVTLTTTGGPDATVRIPSIVKYPKIDLVKQMHSKDCVADRYQLVSTGQPVLGDKIKVYAECTVPVGGKITALTFSRCDGGPCGWLTPLPAQVSLTDNTGRYYFGINTSDYLVAHLNTDWEEIVPQCVENCTQ